LQRAFPSISRRKLFEHLAAIGISKRMLNAIESYHSHTSTKIRFNGFLSKSFVTNVGVREGGVLSPLLFLLFFNDAESAIVNSASFDPQFKLGEVDANCAFFADDVIVAGVNQDKVGGLMMDFQEYCNRKGLNIFKVLPIKIFHPFP